MEYRISISKVDISAKLKNIDIDIDKAILKNIDKDILENIEIDKEILENVDSDNEILENMDIDKISNRLEFGILSRASNGIDVSLFSLTDLP